MNKLNLIPLSLASLTILAGTILVSSVVSADDSVVDEINITVPLSCTLSGTGMDTHNAEINNGTYNSAIGETTLKAFCNDNEGFAIYAIGYTDNEEGKNVLTNSTLGSTYDIVTGTATSGNNSNWAMRLSTITNPAPTYPIIITGSSADTLKEQGDPDYSTFQEVPDDYEKVAYRTSATDTGTNTEGSTLKTTYQAYISPAQPAGTYTGQIKYTLVHPHTAPAPLACKPNGTTITTIACMQDIGSTNKSTILASMTEGNPYLLYDSRDERQYHVAKLADGNVWMLDNLALDPTNPTTAQKINAANTNATQIAIDNLLNGGSNITGWSKKAVDNVSSGWSSNNNQAYVNPWINNSDKDTLVLSYGLASENGQAKVGIYYNFCAASVGTYCYARGSGIDVPDTIMDSSQDICPANWRMPTGGDAGEYVALYGKYDTTEDATSSSSLQYNLSTSLSGYYDGNSAGGQNNYGNYWSVTYGNNYDMHYLAVYQNFSIDDVINRSYGQSIRCLVSYH